MARTTDPVLKFLITADDQASPILARLNRNMKTTSTAHNQMSGSMIADIRALSQTWVGTIAKITAAYYSIKKGWEMMKDAAAFEEQKSMLNALAQYYGTTADALISQMVRASTGMLSIPDAARIAGEGLQKGLKPDELVKLAGAAVNLSKFMKTDVKGGFEEAGGAANSYSASLDKIFQAIALGKQKALKQAIGVFDLKDEAEGAKNLTALQKQHMLYQLTIDRSIELDKKLGVQQKSTDDKMQTVEASAKNLRLELGGALLGAAREAWDALSAFPAGVKDQMDDTRKAAAEMRGGIADRSIWEGFWPVMEQWKDNLFGFFKWVGGGMGNIAAWIGEVFKNGLERSWEELKNFGNAVKVFLENFKTMGPGMAGQLAYDTWSAADDASRDKWLAANKTAWDALLRNADEKNKAYWKLIRQGKDATVFGPQPAGESAREAQIAAAEFERLKKQKIEQYQQAQKIYEAQVAYQEKIDKAALERKDITEVEAIHRRFNREKDIYAAREKTIQLQLNIERSGVPNLEKIAELEGQLTLTKREHVRLSEYEALEIELQQIKNSETLNGLLIERGKLQREAFANAWETVAKTNGFIEGDLGTWMGRFEEAGHQLASFLFNPDAWNEQETKLQDQFNKEYDALIERGGSWADFQELMRQNQAAAEALHWQKRVEMVSAYAQAAMAVYGAMSAYRTQADARAIAAMEVANNAASVADQKRVHKGEMTQREADERQYARDVALYSAKMKQEKEAFQVQKTYALLNAAINTAVAITKVLYNPALAVAVGVMGAAQIAAIESQQYIAPAPPTMRETEVMEPVSSAGSGATEILRNVKVDVHIYGNVVDHDAFARETVPSILKAIKDGVH